jgi:hypothetical protein
MSTEFDDELSEQERRAFDSLVRERTPPAALEESVVHALRREGLLRASVTTRAVAGPRRSLLPRVGFALAASVALFALGVLVGSRWWSQSPPPQRAQADSPQFMLVLRPLPAPAAGEPPGAEAERVREYSAWAREARRAGLVGGEKLKDEARVLRAVGSQLEVAAGQESEVGSGVGGYFIISARDYDHAVSIARDCPHLKHGGTIEIRQIDRH